MPKVDPTRMIALKAMVYSTRRLQAGDEFFVRDRRQARVLEQVTKQARVATAPTPQKVAPPPKPPTVPDELDALREQAESLGLEVDKRWGARTLQDKIHAAARAAAIGASEK